LRTDDQPSSSLVPMGWIYSEYLSASSLGRPPDINPGRLHGWLGALWEIREVLGQEFADRAVMWSVMKTKDNGVDDDLNKYFGRRLDSGLFIAKNDIDEVVKAWEILKRHGLRR